MSSFVDTLMHEDSTLILTVFANDIDNAELNVYAYSSQNRVSAFVEDTLLYINLMQIGMEQQRSLLLPMIT